MVTMLENITYRHLKNDVKRGEEIHKVPYATLAMVYDEEKRIAYFSASLCSEEDNFAYARGREIASYRMDALLDPEKKTPKQLIRVDKGLSFQEAKTILHNLYITGDYSDLDAPTLTYKLALTLKPAV